MYSINLNKIFVKKLNFVFVLTYIVLLELSQITFFHNAAYNKCVNLVLGIISLVLLLNDLFTGKFTKILKVNFNWLLANFMVVCVISMVLNVNYGFKQNIFSLFGIFSNFYFMYNFAHKNDFKSDKIERLLDIISDFWLVGVMAAIFMYVFQISFTVNIDDGVFQQGFAEQRLFGLFMNVNVAAVISVMVIIYKIFRITEPQSRLYRTFSIINSIFQYTFVVLSSSRTALYGMAIVSMFVGYFLARNILKKKLLADRNFFREIVCFAVGALGIVANFSLYRVSGYVLSYVPGIVEYAQQSTDITEEKPTKDNDIPMYKPKKVFKQVELTREDYKENDDVSNNRFKIWRSVWVITKTKPIFGISPKNLDNYIKKNLPNEYLTKSKYRNIHNGFLELFLYTGFVGGITMCIFLVLCVVKILKFLLNDKFSIHKEYKWILLTSSCFLLLSFASSVTASFCFDRILFTPLLWLFLGITIDCINKFHEKITVVTASSGNMIERRNEKDDEEADI